VEQTDVQAGLSEGPRPAAKAEPSRTSRGRQVTTTRKGTLDVHLNLNVRGMTSSATVAINERCNELVCEGKEIFKLGLGQSPFPVPDSVVEELRKHAHEKDYLPVMGLQRLRSAVADCQRRMHGLSSTWDDVLIGPGSKELMFLLQLVYYGDLVIPRPSWVSYAPQARIIGRQVRWLETDRDNNWRLMPDELAALCEEDPGRPRVVIVNYPSNPTGATYSTDRLKELAQVARRHRVVLLSDEIYGELHHKGQHVSIARFYPEGTIVSSGLSKWCGAGGWRLGTFTFPPTLSWLRDAMGAVASETFTSTSAPIQYAAVRAFEGGDDIERYLWKSRKLLGSLGRWAARRLALAGISIGLPSGGFYLFPDFAPLADRLQARGITTGRDLCARLLEETGVAILPGCEFGRPDSELTARLAYVDFDGARALAAVDTSATNGSLPESFLRDYCEKILTSVDRIGEWVQRRA
jgi:aspartate aminotransferase